MSSEENIQKIIHEAKSVLQKQTIDDFLRFIENKTAEFEKKDNFLESIVLWHFFSETAENLEEEDYLAYGYSKIISRYLLLEEIDKAKEFYEKSVELGLEGFHLDTVKSIYEGRTISRTKREIVEIGKKDIFGDFVPTVTAPNVFFDTLAKIRTYIVNELPKGTYLAKVYNHKTATTEEIQLTTEILEEFEVISIQEIVRIE
ncbi:MAG: hypothetical protein ACTSX6_10930 [Candidatus Heimdallarchaeaceae archaeon]